MFQLTKAKALRAHGEVIQTHVAWLVSLHSMELQEVPGNKQMQS
jgi:hypothetical protein